MKDINSISVDISLSQKNNIKSSRHIVINIDVVYNINVLIIKNFSSFGTNVM